MTGKRRVVSVHGWILRHGICNISIGDREILPDEMTDEYRIASVRAPNLRHESWRSCSTDRLFVKVISRRRSVDFFRLPRCASVITDMVYAEISDMVCRRRVPGQVRL